MYPEKFLPEQVVAIPAFCALLAGKRIIIVLGSLELGGTERQALHLARYMQSLGAQVHIWGSGPEGRVSELCNEYKIAWRSVRFPNPMTPGRQRRVKEILGFAAKLRRERPDIILSYTSYPNILCGLTWRLSNARVCIWNQRDEGLGFEHIGPRTLRLSVQLPPKFVSNSQHGADFLIRRLGVKQDKVRVIYNGVELDPPEADRLSWRNRLEIGGDTIVACMVGNLHSRKDHITLLKAWRKVLDRYNGPGQPVLLLAGQFVETHVILKALAYDLELGRSIRFLGRVDDISGLLNAVDLGVFSSRMEGCPNGVLECMAAGLPVVGTDIPGIREAVGVDGQPFLAPPENAEILASRILMLATDAALRADIGTKNRRRIEREFSLRRMCEKMVALLSSSLS